MQIIEGIPYSNFKTKMKIINTELKGLKFMDLGGVLYHFQNNNITEELPSYILCRDERRCKIC